MATDSGSESSTRLLSQRRRFPNKIIDIPLNLLTVIISFFVDQIESFINSKWKSLLKDVLFRSFILVRSPSTLPTALDQSIFDFRFLLYFFILPLSLSLSIYLSIYLSISISLYFFLFSFSSLSFSSILLSFCSLFFADFLLLLLFFIFSPSSSSSSPFGTWKTKSLKNLFERRFKRSGKARKTGCRRGRFASRLVRAASAKRCVVKKVANGST